MAHLLDQLIDGSAPGASYARTLGLPQPLRWEPGRLWARWKVDTEVLTPWGAVFGGYQAALADEIAGLTTLTVLEPEEAFSTGDLRVSSLRPIRDGTIALEGRVIHRGRTTIHVEVEFRRDDETLVAKASAIQMLFPRPPDGPPPPSRR